MEDVSAATLVRFEAAGVRYGEVPTDWSRSVVRPVMLVFLVVDAQEILS